MKTETIKKARSYDPVTNTLSAPHWFPYDPKIGEVYTVQELLEDGAGQIVYSLQADGRVTQ